MTVRGTGTKLLGWFVAAWLVASGPAMAQASAAPAPRNGRFDFSGMDRLWSIVATLERDGEPADSDWDALVRTPGYAALGAHERGYGLDFLKTNVRLVFKPSLAADLQKAPRSSGLNHFLELKEKKTALQAFEATVQQSAAWTEAIGLVEAWLPDGATKRCPAPAVSFIIFAKDARGGYGPLIFDLLFAFERAETFKSLIAHEMLHYYAGALPPTFEPGRVRQLHQPLLNALGMLQNEGLADQIDKAEAIESGAAATTPYEREYLKNLADSPRVIGQIDDLLCRLSTSPHDAYAIGSQIRAAIPQSGHPTGYFMARAVLRSGTKRDLVRTLNNPFAFVYLYNAAAARDTALPRFSNLALGTLARIERDLGGTPENALARAAMPGGIDWSSVTLFRKITAALVDDEEPDASMWDALFSTPGYRVFFAHEGDSRASLRDAMELVYRPSRKADLERQLAAGSRGLARYFVNEKTDIDAAARAWEQWQQSGAFDRAVEDTLRWLPADARDILAGSALSLAPIGTIDLRYGYEALVVDPLMIQRMAPGEMARWVRIHLVSRYNDAVRPHDNTMLTRAQAAFLRTWDDVQRCGIGDLVNREAGDLETGDRRRAYEARLREVPALLARADAVMARAGRDPKAWLDFESLYREFILLPGSPAGYFMASVSHEMLGREALAAVAGNPVAFLELYQKAARKKGGLRLFSQASLDWIAKVQRDARIDAHRF